MDKLKPWLKSLAIVILFPIATIVIGVIAIIIVNASRPFAWIVLAIGAVWLVRTTVYAGE